VSQYQNQAGFAFAILSNNNPYNTRLQGNRNAFLGISYSFSATYKNLMRSSIPARARALVTKYQTRIPGPLLDRIDIHVEVPRVDYEKLNGDRVGEIRQFCRLPDEGQTLMRAAMT
jgi:hypothetical protein